MFNVILLLHIIAGTLALFSGLVAIFSAKGRKTHRRAGSLYFWSMVFAGLSAIVLTCITGNTFLLAIGVFSLYLVYSGRRALFYFKLRQPYTPTIADKLPVWASLLTGVFMVAFPLWQMLTAQVLFVPVLAIFGAILLINAFKDLLLLRDPAHFRPGNKSWLVRHISMMGGAYIATVTAFAVNNVHLPAQWLVWVIPTAAGSVLIARAVRKWRTKLKLTA